LAPLGEGLTGYGKAGVGICLSSVTTTITWLGAPITVEASESGLGFLAAGGVVYDVSPSVGVFAELGFLSTNIADSAGLVIKGGVNIPLSK
jgi:hypothetical protein